MNFLYQERLCSEKVNMEREKAHLEFSVLVHGSYCKTDDSGDHDQDIHVAAAVPCEITDDVDVPVLTCDSGKSECDIMKNTIQLLKKKTVFLFADYNYIRLGKFSNDIIINRFVD